ncbi:MAG: phosphatidate cytidylyltransferase [Verrucomicrobia bacterium]|nr:phosphatidate cytidylyltransferase [Verrucomicrobiota bacterium]
MKLKQLADFHRRLVVSLILGLLMAGLIAFSTHPIVSYLLIIAAAGFAAVGVWEYAQLAIEKGLRPCVWLMCAGAVGVVVAFYVSLALSHFPQLPILVLAGSMILFFIYHFRETFDAIATVAVEFFGLAYVAVPLSLTLGILYPVAYEGAPQEGRWWLFYLIFVTKMTDVGAYFVGRLWGKTRLCPTLSPKKTVEGAIAGFICATCSSIAMQYFGKLFFGKGFGLSLIESVGLGMLIGVAGQIGDLAESLLKRDADVKDSNRLPGLGGVLDTVDALLFTTPIVYFFIRMH